MIKAVINTDLKKGTINKYIYGHFAEHLGRCIYEGIWVGEDSPIPNIRGIRTDVLEALRELRIPVLRWPGGCFADDYHWQDGIGPRENRPSMVNTHWGGVVENNHFGTHEFMELCDLLGAEPYICGNVGSGTVREMRDWIEYMTFDGHSPMADLRRANGREEPWKLRFFGIGNENWGCGGHMRPEYYADLYRQYSTYVRNYSDNHIYKIACGANVDDYRWTEVLMREAHWLMDGLSLHYYTIPGSWEHKRSALVFDQSEWNETMQKALYMDELITRHSTIMDKYDPMKRVGLIVDEWGTWYASEPGTNSSFLYQQNTIRDALVAGITLNIFNNHCDRVQMANLAQLVNVLQAVILTDGDKMIKTPTYHVFNMYKVHQDAKLLPIDITQNGVFGESAIPQLSASASINDKNEIHLSLCNLHPTEGLNVQFQLRGETWSEVAKVSGTLLTAEEMNAHNSFENPNRVKPVSFEGASLNKNELSVSLPPKSVVTLKLYR